MGIMNYCDIALIQVNGRYFKKWNCPLGSETIVWTMRKGDFRSPGKTRTMTMAKHGAKCGSASITEIF